MYGTIARLRAKPGAHEQLMDVGTQDPVRRVPGYVASPAQDASYRRLREFLTDDPEWHDGEIVSAFEAI
jgi:hypothetical protein